MKVRRNKYQVPLKRLISAVVMSAGLWLLTGLNFFLYPQDKDQVCIYSSEERAPQGPVEEKAPENKSLTSLQEEYLHSQELLELAWFNRLAIQKIHAAEKLRIVHYDIISPPPKS